MTTITVQLVPYNLGLPPLHSAIWSYVQAQPYPRLTNWLSVIVHFNQVVLNMAILGHTIVATCRMAGFRAPLNTDRPFTATTIAEFYNRIYYYFKELLVDFFFYPVFFRAPSRHPRLRIFLATLAAAGFGNVLYHYLRDIQYIERLGLWRSLVAFQVYILYGAVLGVAIGFSQLRATQRNAENLGPRPRCFFNTAVVMLFYCLVMILDKPQRNLTVVDYGGFMLNLFFPFER